MAQQYDKSQGEYHLKKSKPYCKNKKNNDKIMNENNDITKNHKKAQEF